MLSRPQQILLKCAQREAGLSDEDYRDALEAVSGCRSSTDARMTDRHLDRALAYLEAILWRKVDLGQLQAPCKPGAVFRQRGYWAGKNTNEETSRDRYALSSVGADIAGLETELSALGFGAGYCASIREAVTKGERDLQAQHNYRAALERTLRAKKNKILPAALAGNTKKI